MFQPTEQALPPSRMHLIGEVRLPSPLLLDSMLFLHDLLVHSGVAPGCAEIAHESRLSPVASGRNRLTTRGGGVGDRMDARSNTALLRTARPQQKKFPPQVGTKIRITTPITIMRTPIAGAK